MLLGAAVWQKHKAEIHDDRRNQGAKEKAQRRNTAAEIFAQDALPRRVRCICNDREPATGHRTSDHRVFRCSGNTLDLRREISAVIREVKPDRVLTQSSERNYNRIYASHPDHLATGEAALCAVYPDARNEFAFPELLSERGLQPHAVPETWIMAGPNPKHFVDTTDVLDKKIAALLCHASQHSDPEGLPERMRGWGQMIAEAGGLPKGRTAEAFLVVDTK